MHTNSIQANTIALRTIASTMVLSLFAGAIPSGVLAAPRVDEQTISWPNDGWYQVQDAVTYMSLCEGGLSCDVSPGLYTVINHSTGVRYPNMVVAAGTEPSGVIVEGNRISWPTDGWYQVQDAETYASVCEGGAFCDVDNGVYNVINHTSGVRYDAVEVTDGGSPLPGSDGPTAPKNVTIAHYSNSYSELFWDRPGASDRVVGIEVYRDGELIGLSQGTSFQDSERQANSGHWYELVAVNADGERSLAGTLNVLREAYRIQPSERSPQERFVGDGAIDGASLFLGLPVSNVVQLFERNEPNGDWQLTQVLEPNRSIEGEYSEFFGRFLSLDGNDLVVPGITDRSDGEYFNRQLYMFAKGADGQWQNAQVLNSDSDAGRTFGVPTLANGVMMLESTNRTFNSELVVFENSSGVWTEVSRLSLFDRDDSLNWVNDIAIEGNTAVLSLSVYGGIEGDIDYDPTAEDYSAVVVLGRNDDGWYERERLLELARPRGFSVDIDEGRIVILGEEKTVYLYEPSVSGDWELASATLLPLSQDEFFTAPDTALVGSRLVVGAPQGNGLVGSSGIVRVFDQTVSGEWQQVVDLAASVPTSRFGATLSFDGQQLLSSGLETGSSESGFLFRLP